MASYNYNLTLNDNLPVGYSFNATKGNGSGAGIFINAAAGVTINGIDGTTIKLGAYDERTFTKLDTNSWLMSPTQYIAGTGITVTNNTDGTRTIANSAIFSWTEVTGTSQLMSIENGYVANNAGLVTLTLPTTAAFGSQIRVLGKGAGGWRIAQNASGQIHFGSSATTVGVGGHLDSTNQFDCLILTCITANNIWIAYGVQGNLSVT